MKSVILVEMVDIDVTQHGDQIGEDRMLRSPLDDYLQCISINVDQFKELLD